MCVGCDGGGEGSPTSMRAEGNEPGGAVLQRLPNSLTNQSSGGSGR
jgi:hypothetical protein